MQALVTCYHRLEPQVILTNSKSYIYLNKSAGTFHFAILKSVSKLDTLSIIIILSIKITTLIMLVILLGVQAVR